jgi:RNA polymerase sigma-70 factor, ECF subfamily
VKADVARGSPTLEELFVRHERKLGRFLAQIVRSRTLAEDLLQETFVVALRQAEQLARVENVEAWLFGIARNRALHALRTRRRAHAALDRLASLVDRSQGDAAEAVAVRDFLVRSLPPDDRILLVLRYVHGFDAVELAAMTGRTPEAVRQQLSRACRKVAASL